MARQLAAVERRQLRIELRRIVRDRLPRAADAARQLDAHGPVRQQSLAGAARIGDRKRRMTGQHHVANSFGELAAPSRRSRGFMAHQRMRDGLGRDEWERHHAAEQVGFAADAEPPRVVERGDGFVGHGVADGAGRRRRVEVGVEAATQQRRQALGDAALRGQLVLARSRAAGEKRNPRVRSQRGRSAGHASFR